MSPGRGLHNLQQVAVSGAFFRSGEQLGVQECSSSLSTCDPLAARAATVGGSGSFATSLTVYNAVGLSSCGAKGCVIRVRRASGDVFVVPISFG